MSDIMPSQEPAVAPHVLPSKDQINTARSSLIDRLPKQGVGFEAVQKHLQEDLKPGFNSQSKSPNYYGFVTGGSTQAANMADMITTDVDQNLHSHLPDDTVASYVEDRALSMVCELLDLKPDDWPHRIFSTGATASNVLGLACGREYVLQRFDNTISVAEHGIQEAMRLCKIEKIQILTTVPHSSLRKAASIVGLGRACVKDVGLQQSPHRFDFEALESSLSMPGVASIVAVSCAEVNTGLFATGGDDMRRIRELCDQYGAWLHVDAAFGLLARALPTTKEFETILEGVKGLELADSIAGDAHKLLNVPYDCGIFLSRHLTLGTQVFQNTNAAYLTTATTNGDVGERVIPSPLNLGIENSRRFRALPVYATLAAYGHQGYREILERQIRLARAIAAFVNASTDYELLPKGIREDEVYIIVLFRAKNDKINAELVRRINATRKIYVSGTQWDGQPAARFAIANWMVDVERDTALIKDVLQEVVK